jgi:hypothetical protein
MFPEARAVIATIVAMKALLAQKYRVEALYSSDIESELLSGCERKPASWKTPTMAATK